MSRHPQVLGRAPRWAIWLLALAMLQIAAAGLAISAPPEAPTGVATFRSTAPAIAAGQIALVVELDSPSLAAAQLTGARLSGQLAAQRLGALRGQQQRFQSALQRAAPATTPLYSVQRVYNGIALLADLTDMTAIGAIPGVRAIHPLTPKLPTADSSLAQVRAPEVWQGAAPLGQARRSAGAGVSIAVIDTGVDYIHTAFGGPGAAAYGANNTRVISDSFGGQPLFPTQKVVGGYDFVGDSYTGSGVPQPDPDPFDCQGHGSHVAGTAAGLGVNLDGSTYSGPYTTAPDYRSLRIDPGVAPEAEIYALRVFGCSGSTLVTDLAIEWAVDPNGDGDFADHVDVINMSLGSSFGSADDTTAIAAERAAELGVIVVASAGNDGDTYYATGSPAAAARAISVASSVDAVETVDAFQVEAPAGIAGSQPASFSVSYDWAGLTPLSATVAYSSTVDGCAPIPAGLNIRGRILLVDWSPIGSTSAPCGSAVRTTHAEAAGAVGIIMASGSESFHTSILGTSTTPALFTVYSVGQRLRSALGAGQTVQVRLSAAYESAGRFVIDSQVDMLSSFSSRGPRLGDNLLKPDLTAPGQTILSVGVGTGSEGSIKSGTSMAAPHVAGMLALLRALHPGWSVEELKALAMNTASADLYSQPSQSGPIYGPGRVGAGRIDALAAATSDVIAYNADGSGAVSLSFGAVDVPLGATLALTRSVRLANKGAQPAEYQISYRAGVDSPGVEVSAAPSSITLAPGQTRSVTITLTADPSSMRRGARDATVLAADGSAPRHWLGEEAGWIALTPSGAGAASLVALRLPLHAAPRLASNLHANQQRFDPAAGDGAISLSGSGFSTVADISSATASDDIARRSAFELQLISPRITAALPSTAAADLQYVGVSSSYQSGAAIESALIMVGISTYGDWSTPNQCSFIIYVDTDQSGLSSDGTSISGAEYQIITSSSNLTSPSDIAVVYIINLKTSAVTQTTLVNQLSADVNTNLLNTNVAVLPVRADQIGLSDATTSFNYLVASTSLKHSASGIFDQTGVARYDLTRPGVRFAEQPLAAVPAADALSYTTDPAALLANRSLGVLLLAHHNPRGQRAEALLAPSSGRQSSLPLVVRP